MKKILILLCLLAVLSAVFVGCSDMITGLTATDNTPAGADAAALSTDDITFASGDTVDAVTGNFTLPINGEANGSTISWESSDTDVITIDNETGIATVTLPANADTEVTLTATFTDADGNTSTVTITVTVAAQEATAGPTAVTFESAVQTGGTPGATDSAGLTLTFSVDPTTLAASDITVTGATKGALSGTGTTRMIAISDITVGDGETVSIAITSPSGFTISGSPQTAVVYRAPIAVTFESAVQTGGTSETADSTGLTLTFSADPTSLAESDITVTGATKGVLSGTGTTRTLAISAITVGDGETVSVAIANPSGFTISGSPKTAVVYRAPYIGMPYQGGVIAYIFQSGDPGYVSGETHGLIAATEDQSTGIQWATSIYQSTLVGGGTETALGTGSENTDDIIHQNGTGTSYAAGLARDHDGGGHGDWFLPSQDELNKLYVNRVTVGAFDGNWYWSSSESGNSGAWYQTFDDGNQDVGNKSSSGSMRVRAVRSF